MSDNVDQTTTQYFNEVGKHKLPSLQEERTLFTAYKEAQTRSELSPTLKERYDGTRERKRIGQQIACGYLRFVILQARRKTNDPQLLKDLISQGNVGLMIGIERFDLTRNVRFLTYAASWINVCMQEYLHKLGTVHVPSHTRKEMRKKRSEESAQIALGTLRDYTFEEPSTASLNNINIASNENIETDVHYHECNLLDFMDQADLNRVERLTMVYRFGLRGIELEPTDIAQLFYELDGSIFGTDQIETIHREALQKLRSLMDAKGIASINDVL